MNKKELSEEESARLKQLNKVRRDRFNAKLKAQNEALPASELIECGCGCGEKITPKDNFGRPRKYLSGHNTPYKYSDPKEVKRVYGRKRYTDPELKKTTLKQKKKYDREKKRKLIQLKGNVCTECGLAYNGKNICAFQFHHLDPSTKVDQIRFWMSWKRILVEAEKCVLVCANCHFMIHGEEG